MLCPRFHLSLPIQTEIQKWRLQPNLKDVIVQLQEPLAFRRWPLRYRSLVFVFLFIMPVSMKVAAIVAALTATTQAGGIHGCNENTIPTQIRLAYAGHGGMAVSWNTKQQLSKPTLSFGKDKKNLNREASSDLSVTYRSSSTWNNHVTISGLDPDTKYLYTPQCGNQTYKFKTAANPGKDTTFQFAMVGDMGTFGPDGLSATVGKGASNPLKPGDNTTIQSLQAMKSNYKFIWHGLFPPIAAYICFHELTFCSWRHCIRRFLGQGGTRWIRQAT
jgi:hypothetical protein